MVGGCAGRGFMLKPSEADRTGVLNTESVFSATTPISMVDPLSAD
jgi:hypothetical protein